MKNKSVTLFLLKNFALLLFVLTLPNIAVADTWVMEVTVTKIDVGGAIYVSHTPKACSGVTSIRGYIPLNDPNADRMYSLVLMAYTTGQPIAYLTSTCTNEDNIILRIATPTP